MRIKCLDCGYSEEVTLDLFVKILGGATAGFGFWAWTSFLFAGTGFAMAICIAIIGGGAAMLAYKDEIIEWITNKGYGCYQCGSQKWTSVSPEMEKEINANLARIASLEKIANSLETSLSEKEGNVIKYVKDQDSSFSMEEVEELLENIEEQGSRIESLLKDKKDWENHKESLLKAQEKVIGNLNKRFSFCYSSLSFTNRALKKVARLSENDRLKLEQQFGFLQYNPQHANFRDNIANTVLKEVGFGSGGRIYVRQEGSKFTIVCVGNKNSQHADIKNLKYANT